MPADLQRAILDDVIPAIRKGLVAGPAIDVLLLSKARSCVANPDADIARVLRSSKKAEPVVRKRMAEIEHLTHGARELVRGATSVNKLIGYVFKDKLFREYLRSNVEPAHTHRLNILISGASSLIDLPDQVTSAVNTAREAEALVDVAAQKRPALSPPTVNAAASAPVSGSKPVIAAAAAPPPDVIEALGAYGSVRLDYRWRNEVQVGTVAQLVTLMADPTSEGLVGNQLAGLLSSDHPQALVALLALVSEGRLDATPRVAALIRLFVARLYLTFNAIETADRLGRGLLEDKDAFAALPEGEKLRLRNVLARCALRSGRPAEAVDLYRDIFAENPGSPGALMNVVGSAFAVDPALARSLAKTALINSYAISESDLTFVGDILTGSGHLDQAQAAFLRILQTNPGYADGYIGLANLELARGDRAGWRRYLQRYFKTAGGLDVDIDDAESVAPFSLRWGGLEKIVDHPRVTVVMTTFNAADTVDRAIRSVLDQVLTDIELIVVDDCSEDTSRGRVMAIAASDPRVKWLHNQSNMGTYCSKNRGIEIATGEYITFHDSDDWMHPLRLRTHLEAMQGSATACTTSNWLRMDDAGHAIVRRGGPYTHLNPASTFMSRSLFDRIGPFDAVRTGADSEIAARVRSSYGKSGVVNLPGCFGIGLHRENSLTQSGATAFDEFRYSPVRLAYTESWLKWHFEQMANGPKELNLVHEGETRRFPIPDAIAPDQAARQPA